MIVAHVGGLPIEEVIAQLAPAAIVALVAVHAVLERTRRWRLRVLGACTRPRRRRSA